ncbi:hypothetical protein IJ380_00025 [Candidatus Saccharibacteria bacterium]|nr:hypothetical protein [Candidatus Saccharibacteria bacterium]
MGNGIYGGQGAIFSAPVSNPELSEIESREIENSFEDALGRDKTSIKKEMGEEGLREIQRITKKYDDDPYMLNVKVQDMSDTLILTAFGRVREGSRGGKK